MGYTHYYKIPARMGKTEFKSFVEDAKIILKKAEKEGIILADANGGEKGAYVLTDDLVSFNGFAEASHETCYIEREDADEKTGLVFNFCKTSRKRYDVVVVAVLATLKSHFPKVILTSDGNKTELKEGEDFATEALNKKITYKLG